MVKCMRRPQCLRLIWTLYDVRTRNTSLILWKWQKTDSTEYWSTRTACYESHIFAMNFARRKTHAKPRPPSVSLSLSLCSRHEKCNTCADTAKAYKLFQLSVLLDWICFHKFTSICFFFSLFFHFIPVYFHFTHSSNCRCCVHLSRFAQGKWQTLLSLALCSKCMH